MKLDAKIRNEPDTSQMKAESNSKNEAVFNRKPKEKERERESEKF
jgi:hypothetical protein